MHDDPVPHAVVKGSVWALARRFDTKPETGIDDFDEYEGLGFRLDDALSFALMHYAGHPPGTATVYLPHTVNTLPEITRVVAQIASELGVPLQWQRRDDPSL